MKYWLAKETTDGNDLTITLIICTAFAGVAILTFMALGI